MLMTWYRARLMVMMSRWRLLIGLKTAGVCCFRLPLCEERGREKEEGVQLPFMAFDRSLLNLWCV
jgi:hypothetical protein